MLFKSKITALLRKSGSLDITVGKNLCKNERAITAHFASTATSSLKIDVEKLEVPSRYDDVPISNKPYFDFVWENRENHFNKIAMVSCSSLLSLK